MATLKQKIDFLSTPQSYPFGPKSVTPIETHMSWVFLAGDFVYKFKKPARFPFLDFTTLAARRANCTEELRLNRRLARETYLRILPLTEMPNGTLCFGGDDDVVEWLVEMNHLPNELMLNILISTGALSREDVRKVGRKLAGFYRDCTPQIADGHLYLGHLETEHVVNRRLLTDRHLGLGDAATRALVDRCSRQFARARAEIEARIAKGFIVEGHGDLRPEHICVSTPVQILDCLEFDRNMRILDPYDEMNYLGLECAYIGVPWIGPSLLQALNTQLGSPPSPTLLHFYNTFRALLRARICIAHLLDAHTPKPDVWPQRARAYLAMV